MKQSEIIARIKILKGEIELQECRAELLIDNLSKVRLGDEDENNPFTDEQIAKSRKWESGPA